MEAAGEAGGLCLADGLRHLLHYRAGGRRRRSTEGTVKTLGPQGRHERGPSRRMGRRRLCFRRREQARTTRRSGCGNARRDGYGLSRPRPGTCARGPGDARRNGDQSSDPRKTATGQQPPAVPATAMPGSSARSPTPSALLAVCDAMQAGQQRPVLFH